jgi:hypothetical protein
VLGDRPLELVPQVRHLVEDRVEVLARERQEHAGRDRPHRDVGGLVADEIHLAEKLSLGQERDPQVGAVNTLAQYLHLALGQHEESAAVLPLVDEVTAEWHRLHAKSPLHPLEQRFRQLGEQRHAPQIVGRERQPALGGHDVDPLSLRELDLGAVDAVGTTLDLHPGQQVQEVPRRDRHHLRPRL